MVATLVAGQDFILTQDLCDQVKIRLEAAGAQAISIDWLKPDAAADIVFDGGLDMVAAVKSAIGQAPVDAIVQPHAHRRKKFLIADMESTVIEQEMLDELAAMIGQREKIAAITARAMNGELDFVEALRERVRLLKGQPASLLEAAAKRITCMPGVEQLVAMMKSQGAVCWLATGGFTCFAAPVARQLGFDAVHANRLMIKEEMITGEIAEPILDKKAKRSLLLQAVGSLGLQLHDCLAIGDGANDIPMLAACNEGGGLGVAYHAKPKVRAVIAPQVNYGDLSALVYAQGSTI